MAETNVTLHFEHDFHGELLAKQGQVTIGREEGSLAPYDLLLGALGACWYSTFLGIAEKMRLHFERAEIAIHGVKREEVPTTLKTVQMTLTLFGAAEEKGFPRAAELASKHCSIHETLSKVAEMDLQLRFA
ncbi:MAG: OsmC family protein [Christensenellales bacterium]